MFSCDNLKPHPISLDIEGFNEFLSSYEGEIEEIELTGLYFYNYQNHQAAPIAKADLKMWSNKRGKYLSQTFRNYKESVKTTLTIQYKIEDEQFLILGLRSK